MVEPQYPAAVDRYVNLGQFYDIAACKALREEVLRHTVTYKAAYGRAYQALGAAAAVEETIRAIAGAGLDRERLVRRTAGIAAREFGRSAGGGRAEFRYLGGPTHKGVLARFDTVAALCPKVYAIQDSWGLSNELLQPLYRAALAAGHDLVVCPDPNRPDALLHLLAPKLGLAFVTLRERQEFPGETYRRFHLDHLVDKKLIRQSRARLRFHRRVWQALLEEGVAALGEAKASHDRLEEVYNPAVDFQGVYTLAEQEWERIRSYL